MSGRKKKGKSPSTSEAEGERFHETVELLTGLIQNININLERNTDVIQDLVAKISVSESKESSDESKNVENGNSVRKTQRNRDDYCNRGYISAWKDLGGGNIHFSPEGSMHPISFIKKLERAFEDAGVPAEKQVGLALNGLRGSAQNWGQIKEESFTEFSKFKNAFLARYWGPAQERELYQRVKFGSYENGSRADYFLKVVSDARFLSSLSLHEEEVVKTAIAHFPAEIKRGIISSGLKTVEEVENHLREIDSTFVETGNNSNRNNRNWRNERASTGDRFHRRGDVPREDNAVERKHTGWPCQNE